MYNVVAWTCLPKLAKLILCQWFAWKADETTRRSTFVTCYMCQNDQTHRVASQIIFVVHGAFVNVCVWVSLCVCVSVCKLTALSASSLGSVPFPSGRFQNNCPLFPPRIHTFTHTLVASSEHRSTSIMAGPGLSISSWDSHKELCQKHTHVLKQITMLFVSYFLGMHTNLKDKNAKYV